MDFHIIPECYVDTNLVETLVPPTKYAYNHQKGCNNVIKKMKEAKLQDDFALGIVDQDKKILEYTKEFEIIAEKAQLVLLKHPKKHHYLIYITPAIEKWILYNAEEVQLELADFDLPPDFLNLRKHTKLVTSNKDEKFKKLFKALRNRQAEGILVLSKWITHLKSNPYDTDLDFLKDN